MLAYYLILAHLFNQRCTKMFPLSSWVIIILPSRPSYQSVYILAGVLVPVLVCILIPASLNHTVNECEQGLHIYRSSTLRIIFQLISP